MKIDGDAMLAVQAALQGEKVFCKFLSAKRYRGNRRASGVVLLSTFSTRVSRDINKTGGCAFHSKERLATTSLKVNTLFIFFGQEK